MSNGCQIDANILLLWFPSEGNNIGSGTGTSISAYIFARYYTWSLQRSLRFNDGSTKQRIWLRTKRRLATRPASKARRRELYKKNISPLNMVYRHRNEGGRICTSVKRPLKLNVRGRGNTQSVYEPNQFSATRKWQHDWEPKWDIRLMQRLQPVHRLKHPRAVLA